MRITLGGILLFSGGVALAVMGPFKFIDSSRLQSSVAELSGSFGWASDYFKKIKLPSKDLLYLNPTAITEEPIVPAKPPNPEPVPEAPVETPPVPAPVVEAELFLLSSPRL